jgi:hypothetical protein
MPRLAVALLLALALTPTTALARPGGARGDPKAALEKVRKAREADPTSPALALQQAQLYAKVDDAPHAVRAYQEFLRLAGTRATVKERAEALARIQDYSIEVGSIVVRTKLPGAQIVVDGESIGKTPLADPVAVGPGKHVVSVEGSNAKKSITVKADQSVSVELEGGASAVASATLESTPPAPPGPAPPAAPTEPESAAPAAAAEPTVPEAPPGPAVAPSPAESVTLPRGFVGWSITGALGAGAITTGILATTTLASYQSKKETLGTSRDDLESTQDRAKVFAGLAVGLGAAAITAATITVIRNRRDAPSAAFAVTPGFVGAVGTFR